MYNYVRGALGMIFLFYMFIRFTHSEGIQVSLNQNWTVSNENGSLVYGNVSIPSGIYSIYENRTGESVFNSYNDVKLRWLSKDNWTYKLLWKNNKQLPSKHVILTLHGVDTLADVYVNSVKVGTMENMFVRRRFNVKSLIYQLGPTDKFSHNPSPINITVKLTSAIKGAKDRASTYSYVIPPECPPAGYNGECHGNLLRKMQSSFSWDWGLAAPSVGIWKPLVLEFYNSIVIRDVTVSPEESGAFWNISYTIYIEAGTDEIEISGMLTVGVEDVEESFATLPYTIRTNGDGEAQISNMIVISKDAVERWWPNGYGEQKMYYLSVRWEDQAENDVYEINRRSHDSMRVVPFGFRTIELIQDRDDEGYTFYFRVNGVNMFMKGSNWIPSNILPENTVDEKYVRYLLQSAKDANMNMLRVWGGGVYESNYFYTMADRLGILIWQDMMFACAMYPADSKFLDNVATEVKQNVRRIQSHPSIAIWAANNENEVALKQNWYSTNQNYNQYAQDYIALYVDTVRAIISVEDPSREVLTSSPSNGRKTQEENWISQNPQDNHYGDIHFYEYFLNSWNPNIFPVPRFVSEYGFQSYPSLTKWNSILGEADNLREMMHHRQHSPLGNQPIDTLIKKNLPTAKMEDNTAALIYYSQIAQAMAIKTETEVYRAERGGFLNTMGALYWQLNDVWVAPSWSSIEYHGNFKILHHWLKDIFAPETLIVRYDASFNNILIYGIRDTLGEDKRWKIILQIFRWSSFNVVSDDQSWSFVMEPNSAKLIQKFNVVEFLESRKLDIREVYFNFILEDENNEFVAHKHFFPALLNKIQGVRETRVQLKLDSSPRCKNDHTNMFFEILVNAPALFIYLQIDHPNLQYYTLSRNGFIQNKPIQVEYLSFDNPDCSIVLTEEHFTILTLNEFM